MNDLLRRLVSRALGDGALVEPVVGTRFGREPELLSERADGEEHQPAALPAATGGRALPPAQPEESEGEGPR